MTTHKEELVSGIHNTRQSLESDLNKLIDFIHQANSAGLAVTYKYKYLKMLPASVNISHKKITEIKEAINKLLIALKQHIEQEFYDWTTREPQANKEDIIYSTKNLESSILKYHEKMKDIREYMEKELCYKSQDTKSLDNHKNRLKHIDNFKKNLDEKYLWRRIKNLKILHINFCKEFKKSIKRLRNIVLSYTLKPIGKVISYNGLESSAPLIITKFKQREGKQRLQLGKILLNLNTVFKITLIFEYGPKHKSEFPLNAKKHISSGPRGASRTKHTKPKKLIKDVKLLIIEDISESESYSILIDHIDRNLSKIRNNDETAAILPLKYKVLGSKYKDDIRFDDFKLSKETSYQDDKNNTLRLTLNVNIEHITPVNTNYH